MAGLAKLYLLIRGIFFLQVLVSSISENWNGTYFNDISKLHRGEPTEGEILISNFVSKASD